MCTLVHLKAANMRRSITHGWWVLTLADTCVSDLTALSKSLFKRVFSSFFVAETLNALNDISREEYTVSHPCFCFCIILLLFVLFVLVYICKNLVFGFANRKVSWVEFPMIGKSGFVKGHSLSRRHKQYILFFITLRVLRYCHFIWKYHNTIKNLINRISINNYIFYENVQL